MPRRTNETETTDVTNTPPATASSGNRRRFECRLVGPAAGGSIELNGVQFKDGVAELDNPLVAHALANTMAVEVIDRETGKPYDGKRHSK